MAKSQLTRILCCALMFASGAAAIAAPLKGGVEEQGTGSSGTPQGALLDQLQSQLNELRALNARLEKAAAGGSATTAVFPMKVEAADQKFRPRKLFSAVDLPAEDTEDGWYRIPYWRAGKYHREKQTNHSVTGDVTIVSRVDHVYGMQQDKAGGIWHHRSWPHITRVETDKYDEYKIINKYEPIEGAPNEFAFKVSTTDIDVDKKTGKIAQVSRQEEIHKYTPGENGIAIGDVEWQGYTADGNPNTQVERSSVEEEQVEPFRVINNWRGKDLRESFRKFLMSHGKADLVPDDMASTGAQD
jgi:hypothetical protein